MTPILLMIMAGQFVVMDPSASAEDVAERLNYIADGHETYVIEWVEVQDVDMNAERFYSAEFDMVFDAVSGEE